ASGDVVNTVGVRVQARNGDGSTTATSVPSAVITAKAPTPTVTNTVTTTVSPPPPPPPAVNQRPTMRILSTRFVGARLYVRMRVCDDSRKNLPIIEPDSKPGDLAY